VNGILVLDKPKGMTSQGAVTRVRRALKTRRAGHTGTLDPFATGVLPICIGKATKIIPFLDEDFKEYEAVLRLGIATDTMDVTGNIIREGEVGAVTEGDILRVLSKFRGRISQVPPMFSAIKKDGVKLYQLARQGKEIDRPSRTVMIKELELQELNPPYVRFFVCCSKGTYVRVLGSEIGNEIGCGGHLVDLRRVRSGCFGPDEMVSMESVLEGRVNLIPLSEALFHIKDIGVTDGVSVHIKQGRQIIKSYLNWSNVPKFEAGDKMKIYEKDKLVSIGEAVVSSGDLDKLDSKTVVLKLLRVFN
jgi:tRNA pseudouridine55 synthase